MTYEEAKAKFDEAFKLLDRAGDLLMQARSRHMERVLGQVKGEEIHIVAFEFPCWLPVKEWDKHRYHAGMLDPESAARYWDELRPLWIAHCLEERRKSEAMLASYDKFNAPSPTPATPSTAPL